MKRVIFTVTNDLNYDQRMIRICTSLSNAGYAVTLVGKRGKDTPALIARDYAQKRLYCPFRKGFLFYATYNISLFFYLLFCKADILCCIDLDTMLPAWLASKIKNTKRVYDAHEYFSQQKEVVTRTAIYRFWHGIEKRFVPRFKYGYTVSESIASAFRKLYGVDYEVIRNLPLLKDTFRQQGNRERILLYQGAVNEARGLEFLVPAMKNLNAVLHIYGDGNFMEQTKELVSANNLEDKVLLKGKVLPGELEQLTGNAYIGINLVENYGLNQYYSLANKFFDYIHQGIPQLSMNFPEYRKINEAFEVALLINEPGIDAITHALNELLSRESLYERLQKNCLEARKTLNWQIEEKKLISFYKEVAEST